jgi:hypothetical protein
MEGAHGIAMVTGELLENAVKYGDWSDAARTFRLHVSGDGRRAAVSVEHPVRQGDPHVLRLLDTLRWLRGFSSAGDAYRARLMAVAAAERPGETGGLGLARVAYEGGCALRADLDGELLRVTAEMACETTERAQ